MLFHEGGRRRGAAMLVAIIGIMVALALSSSLVTLYVAEGRALTGSLDRTRAFQLAESALEESKYELGEDDDGADSTLGALSGTSSDGTYAVTAVDLGSSYYQLTSTATSGTARVRLEETVLLEVTSRFPGGAISMVGSSAMHQVQLNASTNLLIDGGDSPGMVFDENASSASVGSQFASAVGSGYMTSSDIVGSTTTTFNPGNVPLSIEVVPADEVSVSIYSGMYTDFRNQINNVFIPATTPKTVPGSGNASWGSSGSPVKYRLPIDQMIKSGQTVSGNGNLIFSRNLVVENGGTLNWTGNLIINADAGQDAFFDIDGVVNVTGNIIVVGSPSKNLRFLVKSLGKVTVTGALTAITDYSSPATQMQFLVENDLTVNGLVTTVASRHQIEFKPGSDTYINGSYQIGNLKPTGLGTEFKFKVEQDLEIHKDDAAIAIGANALVGLGGGVATNILANTLTDRTVTTQAFRVLPEA